ncbi:MAG: hypothetical protein IH855_09105, partial [Bacteroidetes bacterium]|nr:hypothetical protein [Bacteroidota bacterium]
MTFPEAAIALFDILEPFEPDERKRLISGVNGLLGDPPSSFDQSEQEPEIELSVGIAARRWLSGNNLTEIQIEQVYFFSDGRVDLIADRVPGQTKKERTVNVYLLTGVRALLESDAPVIDDAEALAYCRRIGAYDKNNHTANRRALGNRATGSRAAGFTLTTPGLDAAATSIKIL